MCEGGSGGGCDSAAAAAVGSLQGREQTIVTICCSLVCSCPNAPASSSCGVLRGAPAALQAHQPCKSSNRPDCQKHQPPFMIL